jgi:hypothetical protein
MASLTYKLGLNKKAMDVGCSDSTLNHGPAEALADSTCDQCLCRACICA